MSSQWVDAHGVPWRFSQAAQVWQKKVGSSWEASPLPSGGLRRTGVESSPQVVVVEEMGPAGASGAAGPPGVGGLAVAEIIAAEYQNGVNATFPLSVTADLSQAIQVFRNGLMETPGDSYLASPDYITFTTPPLDSDVVAVIYQKAQ